MIDLQDVLLDINLAVFYYALEATWERCLWERYELLPGDPAEIRPVSVDLLDAFLVTRERQDRLTAHLIEQTVRHLKRPPSFREASHVRPVVAIRKEGRRQRLTLGDIHVRSWAGTVASAMRIVVRQQYYSDLWYAQSSARPGLTLDLVLKAWEVISTASQTLVNRLKEQSLPEHDIKGHAPVLHVDALCQAIQSAVEIPYALARLLMDFLVYKGQEGDDLWAQPLIAVSDDRVAPVLMTACNPQVRRIIDIWLARLGIEVREKGNAFEAHVRTVIGHAAAHSKHLSDTVVLPSEFKFRIDRKRIEEIDLVVVCGPIVIVGECKCNVLPDEPRDWHKHREIVYKAVDQISRKAKAVDCNKALFLEQLKERSIHLPEHFDVLPIVVLNTALHAGIKHHGVPVVDVPMLETYFAGYIRNGTVEREDGELDVVPELWLYPDAEAARERLTDYLCAPPQLRRLWNSVRDCSIPLSVSTAADGLIAVLHSREIAIDAAPILKSLSSM